MENTGTGAPFFVHLSCASLPTEPMMGNAVLIHRVLSPFPPRFRGGYHKAVAHAQKRHAETMKNDPSPALVPRAPSPLGRGWRSREAGEPGEGSFQAGGDEEYSEFSIPKS